MIDSTHDTTPFDGATPRREAVRMLGTAGAALLAVLGLSEGGQAKRGKRHKKKKKPCPCNLIGLTSAVSAPFSLTANTGVTQRVSCPEGYIAINGGLQGQGQSEVTVPCMIRESHPAPDGSSWTLNVFCTQDTDVPLQVGVICFSRSSFG